MKRKLRRWRAAAVIVTGVVTLAGTAAIAAAPAQADTAVRSHDSHASVAAAVKSALAQAGVASSRQPQRPRLKPVIRQAVRHDTSRPLRGLKPLKPAQLAKPPAGKKLGALPLGVPPHKTGAAGKLRTADVQRSKTVTTGAMPSFEQNFEGVSNLNGVFPPDTNMAVGPNDIVQTVNFSFSIYDKQGNTLLGPETLGTLWQGFGGACDPSVDPAANGGDVVSLYDESANRFIVTQLAYPQLVNGSGGFHECIAISQTGDPTGAWFRYDFLFSNDTLNDYPKFGVWPDAYYMSNNDFLNAQTFTGVTVTAFDRAQMLAGQAASSVQFTIGSQYNSTLLPSNAEGGALGFNPPAGAPNPYFMECDAANGGPCTSDQVDEWDFHVDWTNPANSTFGNNGAPSATLPVAAFNSNLCNYDGNCIPQPGTSQGLDALSDRLMYQSAYRNLGGGTQAIVLNQTVNVSTSGGNQAGVRWYELTNSGSGWSVAQQGTYAPDSDNRWLGSANIDASGDVAVGYSVSSASTFPSIRVAGRLAGDPAGQLSQGEATLIAGTGSQTGSDPAGRGRWGDYSAMQVDPADGCTFWYTTEYMQTTSPDGWQTRVGSFKFPSCTAAAHGDIAGTVTSTSTGQPIAGATVSTSAATTTTDGQGHYDLTLPAGSYAVTAQGYGYKHKTAASVTVTQGQTTTQNFKLATAPSHILSGTVTDGSGHGFGLYAKVTIGGYPGGPIYTNPFTGQYSISLVQGNTYTLTVTPVYPGYNTATASVSIGNADKTKNVKVTVDQATCSAPGYGFKQTGTTEGFTGWTGTTPQDGWTNVDNVGNGQVWQFGSDPTGEGVPPNTDGQFAIADSNAYGPGFSQDTSLVSPVVNMSKDTAPVINLDTFYNEFPGQTGDVDISLDGGQTWTNVWEQTTSTVNGPVSIPIPQAAGQASVQVRFHFISSFGWWWSLDNVFIGNQKCVATPGGYVDGVVTDHNTGDPVNGARVVSQANPNQVGITTANPADPNLANGFYWLFASPPGSTQFTASDGNYTPSTQTVNLANNTVVHQDWVLQAGHLTITPGSISSTLTLGATRTSKVRFANDGTEPVQVKVTGQNSGFTPMTGQAKGAPLEKIKGKFTPRAAVLSSSTRTKPSRGLRLLQPTAAAAPWASIANYPTPIMDNAVAYDGNTGNVYSVAGFNGTANVATGYVYNSSSQAWSQIADAPQSLEAPAGAFLNGQMYLVGGWDSNGNASTAAYAYTPSTNSWSAIASMPTALSATATAVLNGQLYVVGGCTTGFCSPTSTGVYRYDPGSNSWTQLASYPVPVAFGACAGIASELVCAGGTNADTGATYTSTYTYDPGTNTWSQGANMPYDNWAMAYSGSNGQLQVAGGVTNNSATVTNQAAQYDPSSNTWTALPNANNAEYRCGGACGFYKIGGSTGSFNPQPFAEVLPGFNECGTQNIPWLSESSTSFTVQPGQSVTVAVTMDSSTVAQPGAYTAQLAVSANTPYQVSPVGVAMQVNPPSAWSKIAGTVTDASSGNPIAGATVQICTMYNTRTGTCGPVTYTLKTDNSGNFQLWLSRGFNPLQLIAAIDRYQPVSKVARLIKGSTTTVNFALTKS